MRVHCWDYPSYKDVPRKYIEHTLEFVDDLSNGNCLVNCGHCGEEFEESSDLQNCPHCNNDLIFPRADW